MGDSIAAKDKIIKFSKNLIKQTGLKKISYEEFIKLLRYVGIIKTLTVAPSREQIKGCTNLQLCNEEVLLNKESSFSKGDNIVVCKKGKGLNYEKRKGKIVVVGPDYITVKYEQYTECILYRTMTIFEYLVFKGGKK